MRLAVVSDVHGSLVALEAVVADLAHRAPDLVLHGGDLALMGAQPAEVVDRIRELGWPGVAGNTDELLWRPEVRHEQLGRAPKLAPIIRMLFDEYRLHTLGLLGTEHIDWLRSLPFELRLGEVRVVHASPGDLWRAPMPNAADGELDSTYGPHAGEAVAYGHIHRPFVRTLEGGGIVANCGSAGMPWDGDPRASYLLIDEGLPRTVRVAYDIELECARLGDSGHPDAERLTAMRRTGRFLAPTDLPG
jgi:diadenosine tetraphosphatase ApaH/serine/threonine PP2A family protein phosphatase